MATKDEDGTDFENDPTVAVDYIGATNDGAVGIIKRGPFTQEEVSGPNKVLPQRFGRYVLTKRLGVGGMAEVFLAEQVGVAGFKKTCVVKRMLPHLAEQQRFVDMFLREARLAATLHHPNIVSIWDLGEADGSYYIAMEHVDGVGLNLLARTAWRNQRPMPMEVVCCALADAAAGLSVAHGRLDASGAPSPIVHRDISPDNLMVNRLGDTKILDFGIARTVDGERTASGELKGKVPFMSPEQLRGDDLDGRSDLYALGVTAYWMLTGKRPFVGATDLVLMQSILADRPREPKEINATIPDPLNALVMNLLEKDPALRVSSANELAEMLEHVLPSKKSVVAPFVTSVIDNPVKMSSDDPPSAPSGFLPATPHTDTINAGWRRLVSLEHDIVLPSPTLVPPPTLLFEAPPPSIADVVEPDAAPSTGVPVYAFIAGAVVLAVIAAVVFLSHGSSSSTADAGTVVPVVAVEVPTPAPPNPSTAPDPSTAPVPSTPVPAAAPAPSTPSTAAASSTGHAVSLPSTQPVAATPTSPGAGTHVEAAASSASGSGTHVEASAAAASTNGKVEAATAHHEAPRLRDVVVKGPSDVEWRVDGHAVATGSTTLHIASGTKSLVAFDKKRGAKTTVSVSDTIDYAKLPHGKLQARAKPLADVFIGADSLGTTPFPDVDLVAGSYTVRFVYKDKITTKNIDVPAGGVGRALVDFTAP